MSPSFNRWHNKSEKWSFGKHEVGKMNWENLVFGKFSVWKFATWNSVDLSNFNDIFPTSMVMVQLQLIFPISISAIQRETFRYLQLPIPTTCKPFSGLWKLDLHWYIDGFWHFLTRKRVTVNTL